MTGQEVEKMQKDLSDYKKMFSKLEKRCSQEALESLSQKDGEPPTEPIKLADWLIDRGLKDGIRLYGKSDLRKLANYLLIYCGDEND